MTLLRHCRTPTHFDLQLVVILTLRLLTFLLHRRLDGRPDSSPYSRATSQRIDALAGLNSLLLLSPTHLLLPCRKKMAGILYWCALVRGAAIENRHESLIRNGSQDHSGKTKNTVGDGLPSWLLYSVLCSVSPTRAQ